MKERRNERDGKKGKRKRKREEREGERAGVGVEEQMAGDKGTHLSQAPGSKPEKFLQRNPGLKTSSPCFDNQTKKAIIPTSSSVNIQFTNGCCLESCAVDAPCLFKNSV